MIMENDNMNVSVFRASADQSLYGITPDKSGSNLPPLIKGGKWNYFKQIDLVPGAPLIALDPDEALASIKTEGYHLAAAKVTVTVTEGVPKPF
jgi:hypothetical protein